MSDLHTSDMLGIVGDVNQIAIGMHGFNNDSMRDHSVCRGILNQKASAIGER